MTIDWSVPPSEHFSWEETFVSDTAKARGIQNDWRVVEAARLEEFADRIRFNCSQMEIVREIVGQPISVNSMYRGWPLNKAIGGSATSAHPQGLATDFTPHGNLVAIATKICDELEKRGIKWDQCIYENNWLHFSPAANWDPVKKIPMTQRCQRMSMHGGVYSMGFH